MYPEITASQLFNTVVNFSVMKHLVILDVRSSASFLTSHIPFSINFSPESSGSSAGSLFAGTKKDKGCKLVLCDDDSCSWSEMCSARPSLAALVEFLLSREQRLNTPVFILRGGYNSFQSSYPFLCISDSDEFTPGRFPSEVVPGFLYLGGISSVSPSVISHLHITHLVSLCPLWDHPIPSCFSSPQTHLDLPIEDTAQEDLGGYLDMIVQFIEEARSTPGARVLVHCYAGVSRSTAAVVAFLVFKTHWTVAAALAFVRTKRPNAIPNATFVKQLEWWAQKHRAVSPTALCEAEQVTSS